MSETLCEKYGFDEATRDDRLALARLTDEDLALAQLLNEEVLQPHVVPLVDAFYAYLMDHSVARPFLKDAERIEKLVETQQAYLLSLGMEFNTPSYFEQRLRAGVVHARMGMPLRLYLSAYGWLREHISDHVQDASALNATQKRRLTSFLNRILTLDEILATETYHLERMDESEGSLSAMGETREQLFQPVDHDSLTGVASRANILVRLQEQTAREPHVVFSLMMIDLDHFKQVNDKYGHLVGDSVLREVSGRIRGAIRDLDLVGRYGGEEFLLLLPASELETAVRIAERIRESVATTPLHTQEANVPITVSIGVTQSNSTDTPETLISRADYSLFQAKEAGRNRVNIS